MSYLDFLCTPDPYLIKKLNQWLVFRVQTLEYTVNYTAS